MIIVLVIPYIWALTSNQFWRKEDTYREQPAVEFNHKVLVQLDVVDSSLDYPNTALLWSTEPAINALASDRFRPALVLANAQDDNSDVKAELFNVTVDFPLSVTESVVGIKALAFFNYQLSDRVSGRVALVFCFSLLSSVGRVGVGCDRGTSTCRTLLCWRGPVWCGGRVCVPVGVPVWPTVSLRLGVYMDGMDGMARTVQDHHGGRRRLPWKHVAARVSRSG
jgi:hypothetical protein